MTMYRDSCQKIYWNIFFKLEVLDSQAKTTVDDVLEGFRERNLLEKLIDDSYVVRNLSTAKEVIGGAVFPA